MKTFTIKNKIYDTEDARFFLRIHKKPDYVIEYIEALPDDVQFTNKRQFHSRFMAWVKIKDKGRNPHFRKDGTLNRQIREMNIQADRLELVPPSLWSTLKPGQTLYSANGVPLKFVEAVSRYCYCKRLYVSGSSVYTNVFSLKSQL